MPVTSIVDEGLGNSSYLVDLGDGGALVVDPERDPRPYQRESVRRGLRIRFVIETHLHADFVSGAGELTAMGAELLAPAGSTLLFPHRPVGEGDEIDLGGLTSKVIATPGHTPEHLSYLLTDGSAPIGLFSGGTLTAGGVARTDLLTTDQTEPLARAAYRSIRDRLFTLPDDLTVYPTHGAGSFCSVGTGTERVTTIGIEKRSNPLVTGDADEDTFVQRLLAGYGSYPPYFLELREVNRRGPRVYGPTTPSLPLLSLADFDRSIANGAELIDVRTVEAFAASHIPGSVSNPWRDQFATWLGWLVLRTSPVVFIADGTINRLDLVWSALEVGFEDIVGELDGGIEAWIEWGRPTSRIPIFEEKPEGRTILDVRQSSEFETGHLSDAVHVELGSLLQPGVDLPQHALLAHCGHGERAMTAASLLARSGRRDVAVFKGAPHRLGPLVSEQ
jgi:glyoxylase-like metal-dependent hydrolase (beta-lactamase superfamily II)/rhodanese-related sulfurtransferase